MTVIEKPGPVPGFLSRIDVDCAIATPWGFL